MILARKPLLWQEKSAFARFCPKVGKEPENPRVGGSIPPLATNKLHVFRGLTIRPDFGHQLLVTNLCP